MSDETTNEVLRTHLAVLDVHREIVVTDINIAMWAGIILFACGNHLILQIWGGLFALVAIYHKRRHSRTLRRRFNQKDSADG